MAISKSLLLAGVSGRIGNIVVRQRNGKTILSVLPIKSDKPPTAKQQEVRDKFTAMHRLKRPKI